LSTQHTASTRQAGIPSLTLAFDDEGDASVDVLGGKGAGLVRMTRNGLNVPPGYVISTGACRRYLAEAAMPAGLVDEVLARLDALAARTGKTFGGGPLPLLLSVRSGAPISMPGMMDTILNLGLNRDAAQALARATGDARFMADVLFRFHGMYAETVLGAIDVPERSELDALLDGVRPDTDPGQVYDKVWEFCQDRVLEDVDEQVPDDPREQLLGAIEAVFSSWNTRRAVTYREVHKIPDALGTAVVVQSMAFGNIDAHSGSGVVFTRNPVTGEPGLFGEFLHSAQGEDVVAGTRTPDPVGSLAETLPDVFEQLRSTCVTLERTYNDVLDIEFTVERGALYLLQVRSAKRTAQAAIRIAIDFVHEGLMSARQALTTVSAEQVRQVQRPGFEPEAVTAAREDGRVLATGVGASPGQVTGMLILDPDRAEQAAKAGESAVLVRPVTSPTDLHGMIAADGILTATGGSTSHAAVVARALGKTCVVGCSSLRIDPDRRTMRAGDIEVSERDPISLDGTTGEVFAGGLPLTESAAEDTGLAELLKPATDTAGSSVLARVTTAKQVGDVLDRGATGVVTGVDDVLATSGHLAELVDVLQRGTGRIDTAYVQRMITEQFAPLFAACEGIEVGVRAIDFQAHEAAELLRPTQVFIEHPQLAMALGAPELIEAQIRGLAAAAREAGTDAAVHLAVRNLSDPAEARALRELQSEIPGSDRVRVGAYVTSPRGALAAGELAAHGDVLWLELRVMQAAIFGIAPEHLLTQEPLEGYLRRGMLGTDPRTAIDPAVDRLLATLADGMTAVPDCALGIRLSGPIAEGVTEGLHRHGFRRFAVDTDEVRPCLLALGKAAHNAA
jgi:pyruvate,orthophosphate dikinase